MPKRDGAGSPGKPQPPPVPPANQFIKAVRARLGLGQAEFTIAIGVPERSMVGRWEQEDWSGPSWEYVGRILVLLGVVEISGKELRLRTGSTLQSGPMSHMESVILEELRKLPEEKLLPIYRLVVSEVTKHEGSASQSPAALKKG